MKKYIKIHKQDNVAVALQKLEKGFVVQLDTEEIKLIEEIPQGHKLALTEIKKGDSVIKYGNPIGQSTENITKGAWVHIHNMKTNLGDVLTYEYHPKSYDFLKTEEKTFMGYRGKDGSVGVRNEVWVIPTVGCVNNVATDIVKHSECFKSGSIDSITAFPHPYGCSQMGYDQEQSRRILGDLIRHPNAGGVLVLGLGCENSGIEILKEYIGEYDTQRVRFLKAQECEDEIAEGVSIVRELCEMVSKRKREPISCSELVIGMKCGGSDGLSGITANPTVGAFSDILISKGGTTILTEVPEMFGAETLLMNRAKDKEIFEKTVNLINDFKQYYQSHNQTIYENPSPGNKSGGISTLEDKSLGCTQKSGTAKVSDVLKYGEIVKEKGLNLLSAPGNDLVASTALAASGAHIVLFTTGRGTPFASPVPTVKISSNSQLANKKNKWIDFDCGTLVEGGTPEELGKTLFDYVLEIASGKWVKSEEAGYHDMAIFKGGVTL